MGQQPCCSSGAIVADDHSQSAGCGKLESPFAATVVDSIETRNLQLNQIGSKEDDRPDERLSIISFFNLDLHAYGKGSFLDHYKLGQELGQGSFGVVYECAEATTPTHFCFAVKLVDKIESTVEDMKREVSLLSELDHPNIVKFHTAFFENVFVCIVMDKYSGGDVVGSIVHHWEIECKLPEQIAVLNVARQMISAIEYLHALFIIHRDVKGDNFIMESPVLGDPTNKIVLIDFGTAKRMKKGTRLQDVVGTKLYFAPELYRRNYSFKVDLWAVGVILYGLLSSRFPFRSEDDVLNKEVSLSRAVPHGCSDFVLALLCKPEGQRVSSAEAKAHPYMQLDEEALASLAGNNNVDPATPSSPLNNNVVDLKEQVNPGMLERRKELVLRFEQQYMRATSTEIKMSRSRDDLWQVYFNMPFFEVISNKRGVVTQKLKCEWRDVCYMDSYTNVEGGRFAPTRSDGTAESSSKAVVRKILAEHGITGSYFGEGEQAKTIDDFVDEVVGGSATLMYDANKHRELVRVVEVVLVSLSCDYEDSKRYLVAEIDGGPEGERRESRLLPGSKKRVFENSKRAACRILDDILGIDLKQVQVLGVIDVVVDSNSSRNYPGVKTLYRKEVIEVRVVGSVADLLNVCSDGGLRFERESNRKGITTTYSWLTEAELANWNVYIHGHHEGDQHEWSLVSPAIGMTADELEQVLIKHGVDIKNYGGKNTLKKTRKGAVSLEAFSNELVRGESSLLVRVGKLWRIIDVVVLLLVRTSADGKQHFLLETEEWSGPNLEAHRHLDQLPSLTHPANENFFLTVRRIIRLRLNIDENLVHIREDNVIISEQIEEDKAYPGLRTTRRRRLVSATLVAS